MLGFIYLFFSLTRKRLVSFHMSMLFIPFLYSMLGEPLIVTLTFVRSGKMNFFRIPCALAIRFYEQDEDGFHGPSLRVFSLMSVSFMNVATLQRASSGHRQTLCHWSKRCAPRLPVSCCGLFRTLAECWSSCISALLGKSL